MFVRDGSLSITEPRARMPRGGDRERRIRHFAPAIGKEYPPLLRQMTDDPLARSLLPLRMGHPPRDAHLRPAAAQHQRRPRMAPPHLPPPPARPDRLRL